jgi:Ca2+-binding RTX toxin-like protein
VLSGLLGLTNANSVPSTKAADRSQAITANTLKPTECAGITLTAVVRGSGVINGTSGADLILGSSGVDTISGNNSGDCILGGGGNDSINGGNGADVCIDRLGTNTFTNCETIYQ